MSETQQRTAFTVVNHADETVRVEESRSDAEDRVDHVVTEFDVTEEDLGIVSGAFESYGDVAGDETDQAENTEANTEAEVVDEPNTQTLAEKVDPPGETSQALEQLGESITADPLDILPGYMITRVDEEPTLNKRGVSVLAFHYDVSVVDFEVVVHPHETEYEYCSMRFTVERDGKEYIGHGEAHADEVSKSKLLRMAETRAYKRAVIFATGSIVGYQEVMEELQ